MIYKSRLTDFCLARKGLRIRKSWILWILSIHSSIMKNVKRSWLSSLIWSRILNNINLTVIRSQINTFPMWFETKKNKTSSPTLPMLRFMWPELVHPIPKSFDPYKISGSVISPKVKQTFPRIAMAIPSLNLKKNHRLPMGKWGWWRRRKSYLLCCSDFSETRYTTCIASSLKYHCALYMELST